jgi:hypothetical protein
MSFPANPTNGQTIIVNGITYAYSQAKTTWVRQTGFTSSSLRTTGNVNLLGNLSFGNQSPNASLDLGSRSDGIILPSGSTAQRPSAVTGTLRYNNSLNITEYYANGTWNPLISTITVSNVQYLYANNTVSNVTAANITLGGNILINGSGFNNNDSVYINGVLASNTVLSSTQILATVPNSTIAGNTTIFVIPYVSNLANAKYATPPVWNNMATIYLQANTFGNLALFNNVTVSSGDTVTSFAQVGGTVAPGLTFSTGGGTVAGTPTQAGSYSITATATNSEGQVSAPYTINYVVTPSPYSVTVFVVAGGGSGGTYWGGGGGAGGLVTTPSVTALPGTNYSVVVGGGGASVVGQSVRGNNGSNSSAFSAIGIGGGAGGGSSSPALSGGSGGGAGNVSGAAPALQPGSASGGYGNAGGAANCGVGPNAAGGGGGAGAAGHWAGGAGLQYTQYAPYGQTSPGTGSAPYGGWFAGGGGGSQGGCYGAGGVGGGGHGGAPPVPGTANTGRWCWTTVL